MEPLLTGILHRILDFLRDPDPAVRFAACSAIIQYPSLQNNFHQQIIPRLLEIMDDCNGRVQDEGTQAVITFFSKLS